MSEGTDNSMEKDRDFRFGVIIGFTSGFLATFCIVGLYINFQS